MAFLPVPVAVVARLFVGPREMRGPIAHTKTRRGAWCEVLAIDDPEQAGYLPSGLRCAHKRSVLAKKTNGSN